MPDTHTIAEVAADETLLRRLAGEVLNPGPWKHDWCWQSSKLGTIAICHKCRKLGDVPDGVSPEMRNDVCHEADFTVGSLPDIVNKLTQKMCKRHDEHRLRLLLTSREQDILECWWGMAPSEQAAFLLAVLLPKKVEVK